MDKGLEILAKVKRELGVPILTDVHTEAEDRRAVAEVVDVLQTPAFLCRQTDFIRAVAQSGKPVNIKKGQFLAPGDMKNVIDKARAAAREKGLPEDSFMACERGASFGYNNLVSDMRSLAIMRETGAPVVFDATHIRCSCPAARAPAPAASARSCRCWRARPSRWASPACSWRRTPTRPRR
jgi:2-dehydro-3-deoxyphosphooctonate aldolase (KDO 8-P synthase)